MIKGKWRSVFIAGLLFFGAIGNIYASVYIPPNYSPYYQGNENYQFAFVQMGSGFYVDKSSVQALLYNPPIYKLSGTLYSAKSANAPLSYRYPRHETYEYHLDTHQVYICDSSGTPLEVIRTDPHASEYQMRALASAKIMWQIAYGLEW